MRVAAISRSTYTASEIALQYVAEPQYPPVTPRWPPGKWDGWTEKRAWQFYEQSTRYEDIHSLNDKLNELTDHEGKIYYIVTPMQPNPRALEYQQFITKTTLVPGLPELYDHVDVDKEFSHLKPLIENALIQNFQAQYKHSVAERRSWPSDSTSRPADGDNCTTFLATLTDILCGALGGNSESIRSSQVDLDANIEAFWVCKMNEDGGSCIGLDGNGHLRFQLQHKADVTIRYEKPLPEFVPRDSTLSLQGEIPDFLYLPPSIGQSKYTKDRPTVSPGYRPENQFWVASPCEFGAISLHSCSDAAHLNEKMDYDISREFVTGAGILSSFGWTVAQAYIQGFDWMNDVTSPFTTQTVISDGKHIALFAYQLNTMVLWKGNDNNPLRNICWAVPETKLFDSIQNNQVIGFNDNALKMLIKFFKLQSKSQVDISSNLIKGKEPSGAFPYMNVKGEPVIEKPHPPRLFAKRKVKEPSPLQKTEKYVNDLWERGDQHWNEEKKRFEKIRGK